MIILLLHLTRDEVIDIRTAFMIFDSDGSGKIDPQELKKSL
jgi:Ca2+-binding EF-hand superfamily protein